MFEEKKLLTVIIPCRLGADGSIIEVSLGYKKEAGLGPEFQGVINGFGGNVKLGETVREGAVRELFEEARLRAKPEDLKRIGIIVSRFIHRPREVFIVHFFAVNEFSGQIQETDEMRPQWFKIDEVPVEKMWPIDAKWLPIFLRGGKFKIRVLYGKNRKIVDSWVENIK